MLKAHLGGREKLSNLQDEFAEVMEPLGLERGVKGSIAEHQKIQTYYGKLDMLDQSQAQIRQLQADQDRAREMVQRTTALLASEQQSRTDISLLETAALLPNKTMETSQGLAILDTPVPGKLMAVITPDNKAFKRPRLLSYRNEIFRRPTDYFSTLLYCLPATGFMKTNFPSGSSKCRITQTS
jgi:hypothetical protein